LTYGRKEGGNDMDSDRGARRPRFWAVVVKGGKKSRGKKLLISKQYNTTPPVGVPVRTQRREQGGEKRGSIQK